MANVLLTGGAGFFGNILKHRLLEQGVTCVSIDLLKDGTTHENLVPVQGDIRDRTLLDRLFQEYRFEVVYHCAAMLAHEVKDEKFLWEANVDGTRNIGELAAQHAVRNLVFISSNCLYSTSFDKPVTEQEPPAPIETYGRTKLEGEKILQEIDGGVHTVILRSPTIIDKGRLGLLAMLYEFILEGRRVWVVGKGDNVYQFIDAQDLASACLLASEYQGSRIFNVGSDNVPSLRDAYQYVIDRAGTGARVASLPKIPALLGMKLAHALKLSPLGAYQMRMIASSFVFDTTQIKETLGWKPTLTNQEMLYNAYAYYAENRAEITGRRDVSAHRKPAEMGIIRLLKWIS
jgi:nucleoside-diphosphate-sugar epimerase